MSSSGEICIIAEDDYCCFFQKHGLIFRKETFFERLHKGSVEIHRQGGVCWWGVFGGQLVLCQTLVSVAGKKHRFQWKHEFYFVSRWELIFMALNLIFFFKKGCFVYQINILRDFSLEEAKRLNEGDEYNVLSPTT